MVNWANRPQGQPAQQQASAGEVPEWAIERAKYLRDREVGIDLFPTIYAFARYIAANEPAPVDPLREVAEGLAMVDQSYLRTFAERVDRFERHLRARGVTVAKGGE